MPYKSYELSDGHEPVSYEEIDYLAELARMLPPRPFIVNIGAYIGVSTNTFLEARPDCIIFSVDREPCEAEFDNAERFGFDKRRVVRILSDSKEAGYNFPQKVDMVFVDGDHWGAAGDILAWRDKVKSNGILAFHDYIPEPPPENPGDVYQQVNKEMVGYEVLGWVDRVIAFRV